MDHGITTRFGKSRPFNSDGCRADPGLVENLCLLNDLRSAGFEVRRSATENSTLYVTVIDNSTGFPFGKKN